MEVERNEAVVENKMKSEVFTDSMKIYEIFANDTRAEEEQKMQEEPVRKNKM